MTESDLIRTLETILNELVDGSTPEAGWMLNPDDPGLLSSLDNLSPEEASAIPASGGSSVAAHTDHLRYGLELLNRWNRGEEPFADANYSASWTRNRVSEEEWTSGREALRMQLSAWRKALKRPRQDSVAELTIVVASIPHLAYHLGAMRQIQRSIRGPSARD